MPSVLAEIGFLTNPKEESLLRKPEYRQKVAEALYRGISRYSDGLSHFQVAKN
jgi:N-acetylmuramoyl-L-alanine amidase